MGDVMIPLTAHNAKFYTDESTLRFQNILFSELECEPYYITVIFNAFKKSVLVNFSYEGEMFDPRWTVDMHLPEGYIGGGGKKAIINNINSITYSYTGGFNNIGVRFTVNKEVDRLLKIKELVMRPFEGECVIGWEIHQGWKNLGLVVSEVDPDDVLHEILSNICRHSNIKTNKGFLIDKGGEFMILREGTYSFRAHGIASKKDYTIL